MLTLRFLTAPGSVSALVSRLLLPLTLCCAVSAESDTLQQQTEALRDTEAPSIADIPLFSGRLLAEFYAERDYRNAWDQPRARALLALARASRADGFDPADFHADAIERVLDSNQLVAGSEAERTAADLLLSDALLRYVHHFRFGKYNPRHINPGWIFVDKADAEGLKADMALVLAAPDLASELTARLPDAPFYRNLKLGYQRYLDIADRGEWQDIPAGGNLSIGSKDERVPLIRDRLAVTEGWPAQAPGQAERYDESLANAIKDFQRRSGLTQDGVVGPNTLRALNHPLDDRLATIRANLERMRWLYNDLPDDYLFVDLAAFHLHLFRDGKEVWDTRVVIGTDETQTPMFRDEMEYMVFNPTWTVPPSIEKKYKGVPNGYKRVRNGGRYYLVQEPGPRNALGQVKFMFPNGHAIYLHDTPSRHLFARSERAYSHGCVRVKDPLTLAEKLLDKPAWDQSQIQSVVRRGKTRWVHLDDHLTVLLYYLTAVADDEGRVGFRRDIYERDGRLLAALDRPADLNRIAFREPEPPAPADDAEPALEPDMDLPEQAPRAAASSVSGSSPTTAVPESEPKSESEPGTGPGPAALPERSPHAAGSERPDSEQPPAAVSDAERPAQTPRQPATPPPAEPRQAMPLLELTGFMS